MQQIGPVPFMLTFVDALPFASAPNGAYGLSVSPFESHYGDSAPVPKARPFPDALWLDVRALESDGTSQVASVLLGGYDPAQQISQTHSENGELYTFFVGGTLAQFQQTPVLRRSPGGWAWQSLDTVESSLRQRVRLADWSQGKLFDGNGVVKADLQTLKTQLPASAVDLGGEQTEKETRGIAGIPATQVAHAASPLLYRALYAWSAFRDRPATVYKLGIASPDITAPAKSLRARAATVTDKDEIFFGKPVRDVQGRIFYWYCVASRQRDQQLFVLACWNAEKISVLDGYLVNGTKTILQDSGNGGWQKVGQINPLYTGLNARVPITPLVAQTANHRVIAYKPPFWFRVVDSP